MEIVGLLDDPRQAHEAVPAAFATITTGTGGRGLQILEDIPLAFFQGREYGLHGLVLDSALVGTGSPLSDDIPGQGHLRNIDNREGRTVRERQLHRSAFWRHYGLALPDHITGLEFTKLPIFVTGIRFALDGHNSGDCLICHFLAPLGCGPGPLRGFLTICPDDAPGSEQAHCTKGQ